MTSSHSESDPALRAPITATGRKMLAIFPWTIDDIYGIETEALAAAEAAPLDVETVKAALVVLPPPEDMDAYAVEVTARLNAALRSPDTETAG